MEDDRVGSMTSSFRCNSARCCTRVSIMLMDDAPLDGNTSDVALVPSATTAVLSTKELLRWAVFVDCAEGIDGSGDVSDRTVTTFLGGGGGTGGGGGGTVTDIATYGSPLVRVGAWGGGVLCCNPNDISMLLLVAASNIDVDVDDGNECRLGLAVLSFPGDVRRTFSVELGVALGVVELRLTENVFRVMDSVIEEEEDFVDDRRLPISGFVVTVVCCLVVANAESASDVAFVVVVVVIAAVVLLSISLLRRPPFGNGFTVEDGSRNALFRRRAEDVVTSLVSLKQFPI
jgi:hypothetical protein